MLEADRRRYAWRFRAARLAVIAVTLFMTADAYRIFSGPLDSLWGTAQFFAAFGSLGFLTLAAADRIDREHTYLPPAAVIAVAVVALLLGAGYLLFLDRPFRDPDWVLALMFVSIGESSWLLLVLGIAQHNKLASSYGVLIGSAVLVCAIGLGLYRADHAFIYPVHTFLQTALPQIVMGLIIVVAGMGRWEAPRASASGSLAAAFIGLGVVFVADAIWWTQQDVQRIETAIAVNQTARIAAAALVGLVFAGVLRPRHVLVAASVIAILTIGASVQFMRIITENQVLFFLVNSLPPLALSIFALALAMAFECNRSDQVDSVEPDEEGDFGPPLPAWRET
jgi:hypothetical protein